MTTSSLHVGDLIECRVKGVSFEAEVRSLRARGLVGIRPVEAWPTWLAVRPHQIIRKIERQERLGVAA